MYTGPPPHTGSTPLDTLPLRSTCVVMPSPTATFAYPILDYGTDAQKERWLRSLSFNMVEKGVVDAEALKP